MSGLQGEALMAAIARCAPPKTKLMRIGKSFRKALRVRMLRRQQKTEPVQVRLPWGHLFHGVLPESVTALIYRFGGYEVATSTFVARHLKPGDCFVDIGAHFGYFTLLSSHLVGQAGRIVAIEAMPDTFALLQQNVRANALANVSTLNNAAAAEPCTLTFKDYGIVNSSLNTCAVVRGSVQNAGRDVQVNAQPADALIASAGITRVDLIKIDAESSEEHVIKGLRATFERDHPITLIELGGMNNAPEEDERVAEIFAFMQGFGYRAYQETATGLAEITETRNLPYLNVIFRAA